MDIIEVKAVLGDGLRLFDGVDEGRVTLKPLEAVHSSSVTHLRYAVTPKPQ